MELSSISEEQVLDRLRFENPWWKSGSIAESIKAFKQRNYFNLFLPLVLEKNIRRAVVLMGPRRVGKTIMLLQVIQKLIDEGINPRQLCYISIENPYFHNIPLERLFELARKASGIKEHEGWFVFFDEIQYLKNWEVHLKSLVDSYHGTKFIASGSAAAALKLKSNESGAGRFTDFMLPPLTFYEYIHLSGFEKLIHLKSKQFRFLAEATDLNTTDIKELNKHFIDYINFGGFPEVVFSAALRENPMRYIQSDIIDKVLLRDLPSLYGIEDVQELNAFFSFIAYNSGKEFSFENMTKLSGVDKITIKKYLTFLEAAYLIKVVQRVDNSAKRFKRANFFKIYLTNPSLRSGLFSPLVANDDAMGNMVETAIFSQWQVQELNYLFYARWQDGEVDMITIEPGKLKPAAAAEIKWSNRYIEKPKELKSLIHFLKQNKLKEAVVTTIDKDGMVEIDGVKLYFMPSSIFCYWMGEQNMTYKMLITIVSALAKTFNKELKTTGTWSEND
ncbi:MAG: ATP-binding protein [Chitinophagales bacterium]